MAKQGSTGLIVAALGIGAAAVAALAFSRRPRLDPYQIRLGAKIKWTTAQFGVWMVLVERSRLWSDPRSPIGTKDVMYEGLILSGDGAGSGTGVLASHLAKTNVSYVEEGSGPLPGETVAPAPAPLPQPEPVPAPVPAPAPSSVAQMGSRYTSPPGLLPPITYIAPGLAAYDLMMLGPYYASPALAGRFFYDSQIKLPADYFITTGYFWRGDDGRYYELAVAGPGNTWDTVTRQQVPIRVPPAAVEPPLPPPPGIPDPTPLPEPVPVPVAPLVTANVTGFEPVDWGASQPRVRARGSIANSGNVLTTYRVELYAQAFDQYGFDLGAPRIITREVTLDPGRATADFDLTLSLSPSGGEYFQCWTVVTAIAPQYKTLLATNGIVVENLLYSSDSTVYTGGSGQTII